MLSAARLEGSHRPAPGLHTRKDDCCLLSGGPPPGKVPAPAGWIVNASLMVLKDRNEYRTATGPLPSRVKSNNKSGGRLYIRGQDGKKGGDFLKNEQDIKYGKAVYNSHGNSAGEQGLGRR